MDYRAPLDDIAFMLKHVANLDGMLHDGLFPDLSDDLVRSLLENFARFVERELAPINRAADLAGLAFTNGKVTTPDGWKDLYRRWIETGPVALTAPPDWGGLGLPTAVETAAMEMLTSACMAFSMGPVVTQGAVDTLLIHASEELKQTYVPKLVSGEWSGTMNLTEPQAGSDLSATRTKAIPRPDGSYLITGQKIFISYGEHDLTENIIHLVLARLPDAPAGTKGLSLFVVPKFLVAPDGGIGRRNDVRCVGIEHKMGIHASPTCTMVYGDNGGARGWLVGAAHAGLACMFTMMNKARLATGLQGIALGERSWQQSMAFAQERRQGRRRGTAADTMVAIIEHPDVRRMLLTMHAKTLAARAICYAAAAAIDLAHSSPDATVRAEAEERASLLTPIVKAFSTDMGVEVTSLGMQVHGGMGYVEETGIAQFFRDARIAPIYEGTNGLQAIDLVDRKIRRAGGRAVGEALAEYRNILAAVAATQAPEIQRLSRNMSETLDMLEASTGWLLSPACDEDAALAVATPYLRLFGLVAGGLYLAKGLLSARQTETSSPVYRDMASSAAFYAAHVLTEALGLGRTILEGADAVLHPRQDIL